MEEKMRRELIIIVDDDPIILAAVSMLLENEGFAVLTAPNPGQALAMMQTQKPDLIISDINMPRINGYQFYEQVRATPAWLDIPFIFLSGQSDTGDLRKGYASGADHYLVKPVKSEDLRIAVNTRLKRAAEIKSAANKSVEETKQQLLQIFSHELRTPLAFVHGYLSLLEDGLPLTADILQPMRSGVNRLQTLINDLMLVVNLENNNQEEALDQFGSPVLIKTAIIEAVMKLAPQAKEKQIGVLNRLSSDYTVLGIYDYLRDIFFRILDNAIKFSSENSYVTVSDTFTNDSVQIHIRDEGFGISAKNHTSIFKKFNQIDRQVREQQGVGLGLAITERLVSLHRGSLNIQSETNKGTTVTITLPRYVAEVKTPVFTKEMADALAGG